MAQVFKPSFLFDTDATVYANDTDLIEGDTFTVQNGIYAFRRKVADGVSRFSLLPYGNPYIYGDGLTPAEAIAQATGTGFVAPASTVAVVGAIPVYLKNGSTMAPERCDSVVSTTGAAGAAVTATLPAVLGNHHVIGRIDITLYNTAARTGGATPVVVTTTNLGTTAFTFPSAGAVGTIIEKNIDGDFKAAQAGIATTIVCPATTSVIWRVNVLYRTAVA